MRRHTHSFKTIAPRRLLLADDEGTGRNQEQQVDGQRCCTCDAVHTHSAAAGCFSPRRPPAWRVIAPLHPSGQRRITGKRRSATMRGRRGLGTQNIGKKQHGREGSGYCCEETKEWRGGHDEAALGATSTKRGNGTRDTTKRHWEGQRARNEPAKRRNKHEARTSRKIQDRQIRCTCSPSMRTCPFRRIVVVAVHSFVHGFVHGFVRFLILEK